MNDSNVWSMPKTRKELNPGEKKQKGEFIPKRSPNYPISAEREQSRSVLKYTEFVIRVCQPMIDKIMRYYEEPDHYREDDAVDFLTRLRVTVREIFGKLNGKPRAQARLYKEFKKNGLLALRHAVDDWDALVADALGSHVNISNYRTMMSPIVDEWIRENVSKIGSISAEYLGEVETIIRWGVETKQPKVNVYKRLEKNIGITKSKAIAIGRDQLGTLNYQLTKYEQESMGVRKYRWVTKHDDKVRDCHRALHGKIFRWDAPPVMWYLTKGRGLIVTTRYCHPGQDFGCRCVATPVFEKNTEQKAESRGLIKINL